MTEEIEKKYDNSKNDEQKITCQQDKSSKIQEIQDRQNQVYLQKLRGLTNKQIAEKLGVSLSTVDKDLHDIKTNVVKTHMLFQDAGIFEAFQDACGQFDLIQQELWKLYEEEKTTITKLKILNLIKENAASKLQTYEIVMPRRSKLLAKAREEEREAEGRQARHKRFSSL